jgi:hypothetical protein
MWKSTNSEQDWLSSLFFRYNGGILQITKIAASNPDAPERLLGSPMNVYQKLKILADAGSYDPSCAFSEANGEGVGHSDGMGICALTRSVS